MALTRAFLKGMNLTDEQVNGIIEAHTETVDGLKEQIARYKADADKLTDVQKELDALKAKGGEDYKAKYEKEQSDFAAYKAGVEKERTLDAKRAALREIAKDAGLSEAGIAKAVKYHDYESMELDDKGAVKNKAAILKSLKDEWPEHLIGKVENNDRTPTPPGGGQDGGNGNRVAQLYQQHRATLYGVAASQNNNEQKGDSNK